MRGVAGRRVRVRAVMTADMDVVTADVAVVTAAGTRAIGPVCPSAGVGMRGVRGCRRLSCEAVVPDNGRVLEMTREEFEELVAEALDRIPPELTRLMDNVAVFVEDEPDPADPELLGLYEELR